jgi:hypothetical protein
MDTVIGCCGCTTFARESEGAIFKCSLCERNTCYGCSDSVWRDGEWVKVCKVCTAIEYLTKKGYTVEKGK